jgi:hypothetical protein
MARDKISEYDATAANNTVVGDVNIAEAMPPSSVNNALREILSHLKEMDVGTFPLTSPQITSITGVTSLNSGQIGGRRSIIYNGEMKVAQRSTSETGLGAASGYFTTDRWGIAVGAASAGRFTMAQIADGPAGFANCTKLSCTTADTSIAAGEGLRFRQKFEGQDLQQIKKGTASAEQLTISFWVKGNATATYVAELYDNDNGRQISKSFAVTTSWAKITLLIPADTTGAFGDDNAASLELDLWLHAGATYTSGTLNSSAWAAAVSANRAVGISSIFDATSRTFFITGVQMEIGATASEFESRTYGEELALCQRYYYLVAAGDAEAITNANYYSSSQVQGVVTFPTTMRSTPSLDQTSGSGYYETSSNGNNNLLDDFVINNAYPTGSVIYNNTDASGTAGHGAVLRTSDASAHLAFTAEL